MADINLEQASAVQVSNKQILGALLASVVGWSLDLFDLFILLFVAPVVGRLFFPSSHAMLSLAAVYASFGVTLLMRPLGSALFGSYADRFGRKRAMQIAMIGVGISTAAFGLLPTVHQIGIFASLIFLVLRLVQGVFVGGVVASTHTMGIEVATPKWRGAASGLIGGGGAGLGAMFASAVYYVVSAVFPGPAFDQWGWRFMFFSGLISTVLAIFIFNNLEESPLFKKLQAAKARAKPTRTPVRALFSRDYRAILFVNLLITIGGGAGYYLTSGFMPTFLKLVNHTPRQVTGMILTVTSIIIIFTSVLTGHLSTFIGRKKTFILVGLVRLILLPLIALKLPGVTGTASLAAYVLVFCVLGSAGYAPALAFLNERFPTAIRATGTGVSWNIGFAIGGILPTFVSLASGKPSNLPVTLAIFLAAISAIFLLGAFIAPETKGNLDQPSKAF